MLTARDIEIAILGAFAVDNPGVDVSLVWEILKNKVSSLDLPFDVKIVEYGKGSYWEGEGPCIIVISVTENGEERFFKKSGYYSSSYRGVVWDGSFVEVRPKQVMVTDYEEIL